MNTQPLVTWLLAGALLASLGWNLVGPSRATGEPPAPRTAAVETSVGTDPAPSDCDPAAWAGCEGADCELTGDLDLGLGSAEVTALSAECETSCSEVQGLDLQAEHAVQELWHRIADPRVDAQQVEQLVQHVLGLRERSLRTCVESALRVRDALPPEQARQLFERCCAPDSPTTVE